MKFALPIDAVIAAQKCTAVRDVRFYLNGFHVTKSTIEATNGHYLYQAKIKDDFHLPDYLDSWKSEFTLPDSMIIQMLQKIKKPAKKLGCEFVLFEVTGSEVITKTIDQYGRTVGCYLGEVIEGKFPDADRVIPSGDKEPFEHVGFNSEYLKKLHEVSNGGYSSVKMTIYGEKKPTVFEILQYNSYYSAIFVLMPINL